jgi:recombination protein RecT
MVTKTKESEKAATLPAQQGSKTATPSERFTAMVMSEFAAKTGMPSLTPFQKRLIQNYFISIDIALKGAEEKRLKKSGKYQDPLPVIWQNINMEPLGPHVVACSRIGFDPALPNHINMMPFKNNALNKYDIVFIEGYRGKEIKARKYGFEIPDDIIAEVVYSTDVFKAIKKDVNNKVESYVFEVKDPFNRGEIIGGFYYHRYDDKPYKNKLMFYNKAEIDKRRPKYASVEFWGGEKATYNDEGKKNGTEKVEGWYHEMAWKTIFRAACSDIAIDSQKIDDDFIKLSEQEIHDDSPDFRNDVANNQAKETLDITDAVEVKEKAPEATEVSEAKAGSGAPQPKLGF